MVGIILLKDIQTGSHKYFKLAIFSGNSYSDINPEKGFSEYVINIENKKIVSKNLSSGISISYFELLDLCDLSIKFLLSNPHVICLQFKRSQDTEFRIIPSNHGNYVLPDLYNFLHGNAVYFPIKTFTFKTGNGKLRANLLEADVCCELLNFAMHIFAKDITPMYYQAGGTLYVDLCSIIKNPVLSIFLQRYLPQKAYKFAKRLYRERKNHVNRAFPLHIEPIESYDNLDVTPASTEYEALINSARAAKLSTLIVATKYYVNEKPEEIVKNIFEIIKDEKFLKIKNDYYEKLLHFGEKLTDYKYLSQKDYVKYLSIADIMSSEFDVSLRKKLFEKSSLLRHTALEFEKRENSLIAYDGMAFEF